MGQRRKAGDGTRLSRTSRRKVIGVTIVPLAEPARRAAPVEAARISAQCASAVRLEASIDQSTQHWTDPADCPGIHGLDHTCGPRSKASGCAPMKIDAIHRRRQVDDRALARTFLRNAEGFFNGTDELLPRFPHNALHFMAIATELALKAYLLSRGISDDWNRIHVRHDLSKALKSAARAGFKHGSPKLAEVATVLSPHYKSHSIPNMPAELAASIDWTVAHKLIATLLVDVHVEIDRELARPRPEHLLWPI